MPEEYGERFHFYRGIIENKGGSVPFPRGQHIGDETWLYSAPPEQLIKEIELCVNERYYMEVSLLELSPSEIAANPIFSSL
jgi:hypothetical protein